MMAVMKFLQIPLNIICMKFINFTIYKYCVAIKIYWKSFWLYQMARFKTRQRDYTLDIDNFVCVYHTFYFLTFVVIHLFHLYICVYICYIKWCDICFSSGISSLCGYCIKINGFISLLLYFLIYETLFYP